MTMAARIFFFFKLYFLNFFCLGAGYAGNSRYFRFFITVIVFLLTVLFFIIGFPLDVFGFSLEVYSAAPFYMAVGLVIILFFDAILLSIMSKPEQRIIKWNTRFGFIVLQLFIIQWGGVTAHQWLYARNLTTTRMFFASYPNMLPQFTEKALVIARAWGWRPRILGEAGLRRGDIVLFTSAENNSLVTRRIVALPGETMTLREGVVLINEQAFDAKQLGPFDFPNENGTLSQGIRQTETNLEGKSYDIITKAHLRKTDDPQDSVFSIPEGHVGVLSDSRPPVVLETYRNAFVIPLEDIVARPIRIISSQDNVSNDRVVH